MPAIKKKYFLPLCLAGLLAGYAGAEWLVPTYFHPKDETKMSPQAYISALLQQPQYVRTTKSGNYLAGQYAQRHKDWDKASNYIGRVLKEEPDNIEMQKHLMVLDMASGQADQAIALAKSIIKDEPGNFLATLFITLDQFEKENYLGAIQAMKNVDEQSIAAFIVPVLTVWADAATGNLELDKLPENPFYAYHALLAGIYLNQQTEALEYAERTYANAEADSRDLEKTADLFAKAGKPDLAKEIYKIMAAKGFSNEAIDKKLDRLNKDESIDDLIHVKLVDNPKQGAALVFLDMAEILYREYSDDSATIFSQMALHLNPSLDEAHLVIGYIQARHERENDAIAEFKKIKTKNDQYLIAQKQIANLYATTGDNEDAIKILSDIHKEFNDIDALIQVGDIYRYQEDYENAVKTYNKVIGDPEDVPEDMWHVLYARGMAYERLQEFDKSEADLTRAISFRPEHPYLLNYLGYSWADQGIHLAQALDMVEKAAKAQPDDGYIADSLGWVYYKMQEYKEATPHLERAVELLPYDATINDHLGDAYWRVGRKIEARFQWQRAINYSVENETELREKIEQKMLTGLNDATKESSIESAVQAFDDREKPAL